MGVASQPPTGLRRLSGRCRTLEIHSGPLTRAWSDRRLIFAWFPQVEPSLGLGRARGIRLPHVVAIEARGWPRHFSHLGSTPRPSVEPPLPNTLAYIACYWPGPSCASFLFVRLPVDAAAIWSLLAGYFCCRARPVSTVSYLAAVRQIHIPAHEYYILLCLMKGAELRHSQSLLYLFVRLLFRSFPHLNDP